MRIKVLLLVMFLSIGCAIRDRDLKSSYKCAANWQYFDLKKTTTAEVVAYFPTRTFCGRTIFASTTIVRTQANDTLRVLQICDLDSKLQPGDKVEVVPVKKDLSIISPMYDKYVCKLTKTCYGVIKKV